MKREIPLSDSLDFSATGGVVAAGHGGGFVRQVEGKLQVAGRELWWPEVAGLPEKPRVPCFPSVARYFEDSGQIPVTHRPWLVRLASSGCWPSNGGRSFTGGHLWREIRRKEGGEVRERSCWRRENPKISCVLGLLYNFYKVLVLLWNFRDIWSIPKIRVNHLKLPKKILSSV